MVERHSKGSGVYIYGVIQDTQARRWTLAGIGGAEAVYTICHEGLGAIVSDGAMELYEATQENLLAHNKVLEEIVKAFWVLPLRLGTVARGEAEVRAFLQKASRPLREAFSQLGGRTEFDVEAAWLGDGIFKLIAEENEKIREQKERIAAAGKGVGLNEQIAMGMLVAEAINQRKAQVSQTIEEELKALSERASPLKARTKETVFNAAFLVPQEQQKAFEEAIYRLGDRYGKLLKFRYAGPLPCYSFVNLQVRIVEFKAIDEARRALGLNEDVSVDNVKEAYRRLALTYHPDRNPDDPNAPQRFQEVVDGYRLLLGYLDTVVTDSTQSVPLTEACVGTTMIVVSQERQAELLGV